MAQSIYPRVPTVFISICDIKNKLVWHMMPSMLYLFSFQSLEKLELGILNYWLFTELSIFEGFFTWFFKYALIPVRTYFQTPIAL